jgi:DNA-binding ferritin-like protein
MEPFKLKRKDDPIDKETASCVNELLNAAVSFHQMHLKITGVGSFAGHKALNKLYDALPEHADELAEGYQGAAEKILQYENSSPRVLNSVEESLSYIRELYSKITTLQYIMPYSEIVNELDTAKSTLNSIKYKLLFLK